MRPLVALGSTRIRITGIAVAAFFQTILILFLGSSISGGDARTYIGFASDWSSFSRLTSPEAFDGNFWPAGYSGFLQIFSGLGDSSIVAVRLAQMVMAVSIAWMAGELAKRYSERAAIITTLVIAFCPTYFWAVWAIGYELLLGWLLMISLVSLWGMRSSRNVWIVGLGGVSAGLALIVQFRAVAAIPVLLWLAYKIDIKKFLIFTLGLSVPVGLWAWRTWLAIGNAIPWSGNGGWNLWNGNNPSATGHNIFPLPSLPTSSTSYLSAALDWILSHPSNFVELSARRALFLFYPTDISEVSNRFPAERAISIFQWGLAAFFGFLLVAFIGTWIWNVASRLSDLKPLFVFTFMFLVVNIIFIVEARFRIPVEAVIIAICIPTLLEWIHVKKSQAKNLSQTFSG